MAIFHAFQSPCSVSLSMHSFALTQTDFSADPVVISIPKYVEDKLVTKLKATVGDGFKTFATSA